MSAAGVRRARVWCAIAVAAGCGCGGTPPPPPAPPHIVLVSADALRADHLSFNGYPRETSPALDAFARDAWNFVDAVTVIPKTAPSFASLFTGRHPAEHGVRHNLDAIPTGLPMLAEILAANGYRTAAFISNPALLRRPGFERGFEVFRSSGGDDPVAEVNAAFLAWSQAAWDRPSFVWIHYVDPHGPYTPPQRLDDLFAGDALDRDPARVALDYAPLPGAGMVNKILGAVPSYQRLGDEDRVAAYARRYDAEIRYVDEAFAAVLARIEALGLAETTAVVFTSDHGESLGEHDYFFEHGWFAYDASLRIPLVLREPAQRHGRRVTQQVSNLDVFPTLLALAGLDDRWGGPGRSLLGPLDEARDVVVQNAAMYPQRYVGLRGRGVKYLRELETGTDELYRLADDPGEIDDLRRAEPEAVAEARARLRELESRLRPVAAGATETPVPPPGEGLREQLRQLGYTE